LSSETQLERLRMSMEAFSAKPLESSSEKNPIVINNIIPKSSRRVGKITTDDLGNPSIELSNIDDEA